MLVTQLKETKDLTSHSAVAEHPNTLSVASVGISGCVREKGSNHRLCEGHLLREGLIYFDNSTLPEPRQEFTCQDNRIYQVNKLYHIHKLDNMSPQTLTKPCESEEVQYSFEQRPLSFPLSLSLPSFPGETGLIEVSAQKLINLPFTILMCNK